MTGQNKLPLSVIVEAFSDCGAIIKREIRRLKKEVRVYDDIARSIKNGFYSLEQQNFMIMAMTECYMRNDKRVGHLERLKMMEQLMRHQKFDIGSEEIDAARDVKIETIHSFEKLKKTNRGFTAKCPFHDDRNPSFSCRDNKWICFSCLAKGSGAIDFVMKLDGVKFFEAVKILKGQQ